MPVGVCVPRVIGPLKDAWRGGPDDPRERVRGVCDGISRLAQFGPPLVLIVTGAKALHPVFEARTMVVEGLGEIARFAAERDIPIGVEVLREESNGSLYNDLPRTFELLDEVGAENLSVVFDIWHLWDARDVFDQLRTYAPGSPPSNCATGGAKHAGTATVCFPAMASRTSQRCSTCLRATASPESTTSRCSQTGPRKGSIWENRDIRTVLKQSWDGFDRCWQEAAGG